eukprot:g13853.t1
MVLMDSQDGFFSEVEHMFALCKERGGGTVYITLKKVEGGNKQKAGGGSRGATSGGGRREGWLARAKISNKKARKTSLLVSEAEVAQFRARIEAVKKSMPVSTIAGGTKKRGRKPAGLAAAGATGAQNGKRSKAGGAGSKTHHATSDETFPCGDGSNFLGLGGGASWTGFMLPQPSLQPPQPFQRGFLNCFFWCGGPSGNIVDEDEDLGDEEDLAVGLPAFLFGRRLGKGRLGEVRHAIRRSDGESVAVKCVKRNRHSGQEEESALEEAAVLSRMSQNSNIVALLSLDSLPSYHYLVLELLDGGAILDAVAGLPSYTEHDAREITTAVLRALEHSHDVAGCVHRDLRPEKLLISRDPSGAADLAIGRRVKVAGWGRSKRLPPGGQVPGEYCFGNRAFSAPEMILEEPHGKPADMFAVGALLYTLLSGSPPRSATLASAVNPRAPDTTSGPAWAGVSAEAKGLVGALMTPDGPAARLSAKEALRHEWINAGKEQLKGRSLDAVLKGSRVLGWSRWQNEERCRAEAGAGGGGIPRASSMF